MEVKMSKRLHVHSLPLIGLAFVATMATALAVAAANNVPPSEMLAHPQFQTKELSYGVAVAAPQAAPVASPVVESPVVTIGSDPHADFNEAVQIAQHTSLIMSVQRAFDQAQPAAKAPVKH